MRDIDMANPHDVFSVILLNMNWHCKNHLQLIAPEVELFLQGYIADYCKKDPEVFFIEVGGTEDHVQLIVEILPTITISERIGKVKGASSHEVNKRFGPATMQWQRKYGVVSFARRDLPGMRRYVQRQKEHHRMGTSEEILERHYIHPDAPKSG